MVKVHTKTQHYQTRYSQALEVHFITTQKQILLHLPKSMAKILVDQDGVLADFDTHFYNMWKKLYPYRQHLPKEQRVTYYIDLLYPKKYKIDIIRIMRAKGFFRNIPIIAGAKEALEWLIEQGHEVYICTRPMARSNYCVQEKYEWAKQHLGEYWAGRMLFARDKTLHDADILIDDKPDITGNKQPTWEQVLFHAAYNAHLNKKRLYSWNIEQLKKTLLEANENLEE